MKQHAKKYVFALLTVLLLAACGDDDQTPPPQPPAQPAEQSIEDQISTDFFQAIEEPANVARDQNPELFYRPRRVALGPTLPGGESTKTIELTNRGGGSLEIQNIEMVGGTTEFELSGECVDNLPVLLTADDTCEITIRFAPVAPGPDTRFEIGISHAAPGSPDFVEVVASRRTPLPEIIQGPSPQVLNAMYVAQQRKVGQLSIASMPVRSTDPADLFVTSENDYSSIGFSPSVSTLKVDRSRMVTADRYIPAVLENTINSQLAGGRIVSIIEQNVYGADGRFILLPGGSRAIGTYGSLSRQGDTRLAAQWVRIVRPDGVGIAIDDPAADVMGRMGLIGDVDNRYWDRFGVPLLVSIIESLATWGTSDETIISTNNTTGTVATSTSLSPEQQGFQQFNQNIADILKDLVQQGLRLEPIITVPGGTRFIIMPTRDLVFRENLIAEAPTDTVQVAGSEQPQR